MYARMVTGDIAIEKLDAAIELWKDTVLPSARKQLGFRGMRYLVNRASGRIVRMGLWETEQNFRATVEWNQTQVDKFAELFISPPEVGGYEVVVDI